MLVRLQDPSDLQTLEQRVRQENNATRTATGLRVRCVLDTNRYPSKLAVSDAQMASLNLVRDEFHGDWNYTIHPRQA